MGQVQRRERAARLRLPAKCFERIALLLVVACLILVNYFWYLETITLGASYNLIDRALAFFIAIRRSYARRRLR